MEPEAFKPLDPMGIIAAQQTPAEAQPSAQKQEIAAPSPARGDDAPGLPKPQDQRGAGGEDVPGLRVVSEPPAKPEPASTLPPDGKPTNPLRDGIIESANALGIDPVDLATAISYETAGTFDPTKRGPTTQWGQHRGLIQFGQPQAQKYGVDWNNPVGSQLGADGAVVRYLRDTGVKPGMGLMDIYSAINAGGVGRYNRTDANNGGAPGTVADKVNNQMAGHRAQAAALLGGGLSPSFSPPRQPASAPGSPEIRQQADRIVPQGGENERPMPTDALASSKTGSKKFDPWEQALGLMRQAGGAASVPGLSGMAQSSARAMSRSPNAMGADPTSGEEAATLDVQIAAMQEAALRDPRVAGQLALLQQQRSTLQSMA